MFELGDFISRRFEHPRSPQEYRPRPVDAGFPCGFALENLTVFPVIGAGYCQQRQGGLRSQLPKLHLFFAQESLVVAANAVVVGHAKVKLPANRLQVRNGYHPLKAELAE
ncbi:MAG: hypothetical protein OXJ53_07105 [Gammaproteobacteria bacterium]|nr:hypothetical protein [Gammaproteobacteria bacterium]MDE0273329.1 hypothetical protein [Gammaproteobacteria bacterium]